MGEKIPVHTYPKESPAEKFSPEALAWKNKSPKEKIHALGQQI